jgi:hypothetical protein
MLLSAFRSSCSFSFVRLLEGDQLNVCVCVCVRACVLFITSVSWPLGFDSTWSAAVCDVVPRLDPAVFIFKTPDDFAKAYVNVISLTVVRKVWPLLRPFSTKSQLFSAITCRSLAPNFTQIRPKNAGSTKTNFSPPVNQHKYWYDDFPKTHN